MKRGPYKQYLLPGSTKSIPISTRKRRGITDEMFNFSREEELERYLGITINKTENLIENRQVIKM
jgi:hypothetical protein